MKVHEQIVVEESNAESRGRWGFQLSAFSCGNNAVLQYGNGFVEVSIHNRG
jgi:hypothetical protein